MYIFGKNNNHLIKNNYKTTFSLPQKIRLIQKQIIRCACGYDFIICLAKDLKPYCYFQSAVYNIDFKADIKIIDIATQQNLILFVTQKGELYGTQFIPENLINDSLRPQFVKLNLNLIGLKQKKVKQIKMTGGLIFLKMQNNIILELKRNDWMQTKTFSDPQIVHVSKNQNISQIACSKNIVYFMTYNGYLFASNKTQISSNSNRIEIKQKLKKIVANQKQFFGINEAGFIVKIHIKNNKAKIEKIFKIAANFIDLILGNQNYYAITEDREAWVWGKNSYGQLGLSDYEPRLSLYPLVSLQRFYIKQFFSGDNYVCCLVDSAKIRQTVKISQRSSSVCSMREVHTLFAHNNQYHECRDSFNQTEQFVMPIRYTQDESKLSSYSDQNESCAQVNIIVNKKNNKSDNLFNKCIVNEKQASNYLCKKGSQRSKVSNKVTNNKISLNQHNRSKSKSVISKSSKSRLTPKSNNRQKSLFKNKKQKQYNVLNESDIKSNAKSYNKQKLLTQKNIKKQNQQKENELKQRIETQIRLKLQKQIRLKLQKQIRQRIQRQIAQKIEKQFKSKLVEQLKQRQKKQDERVNSIMLSMSNQRQDLKDRVYRLQNLLKNKQQQNKDLFELISHKNLTIQDITKKIKLLQQAIQQHEKILTQRDNEAQQYFIRQKQYQVHIKKLQLQIQKMMDVLNYNQRNKQSQLYKKQIQRLSSQKQYYKQKIKSIQRKFYQQQNIYQLEINNLQQQLNFYKNKQQNMINKFKLQQNQQNKIQSNKLQNNKIQSNKIQNNKIQSNKIQNNKIQSNKIQNNKIQSNKLQNNKIQSNKIQNNKIQSNKIQNNKIQNNKIQNNKIQSNKKQTNKIQTSIQLQRNYNQNNYSNCMQSPTFYNLDIKNNLKQKLYQNQLLFKQNQSIQQSQLTLNQLQQKSTIPLKQSNKQNLFINHLQQNNYNSITKKNSRIYNLDNNSQNNYEINNSNTYYSNNNQSQTQVNSILHQIQQNKSYISKSANKLVNILQNDKIQKHSK